MADPGKKWRWHWQLPVPVTVGSGTSLRHAIGRQCLPSRIQHDAHCQGAGGSQWSWSTARARPGGCQCLWHWRMAWHKHCQCQLSPLRLKNQGCGGPGSPPALALDVPVASQPEPRAVARTLPPNRMADRPPRRRRRVPTVPRPHHLDAPPPHTTAHGHPGLARD